MGSGQSQEQPDVVRIDRHEIPDEYKSVGVSSDVVKRLKANATQGVSVSSVDSDKLRAELNKERDEKLRLKQEMARLSELQQRQVGTVGAASDLDERKRIFDDTVERVQKQFFAYHRENICQDNEKEIMECLKSNTGRVLKCAPLAQLYEKCASDFRQQVLSGN